MVKLQIRHYKGHNLRQIFYTVYHDFHFKLELTLTAAPKILLTFFSFFKFLHVSYYDMAIAHVLGLEMHIGAVFLKGFLL